MAHLLARILRYLELTGTTRKAFWQSVVTELRGSSPSIGALRQHLNYWQKCWVRPQPTHLYVYCRLAHIPITMDAVQAAYRFPQEGKKPKLFTKDEAR